MFTVAATVVGATLAVDSFAKTHFVLWTSWGFVVAYVFAAAGLACFIAAIREWNFPFARRHADKVSTPTTVDGSTQQSSTPSPLKRIGIHNLPGGKVRSRGAKFGPGLDEHIVNQGELDIEDHIHE